MTLTQPAADAPFFIVINAASGKGDAEEAIACISGIFDEAGRRYEFLRVTDPSKLIDTAGEAVERAIEHDGIVVAAGGDGTLSAVAGAVHGRGPAYAVLPQGTFNYFGRVNGIPQELEKSTRALLRARAEPAHVGRVNGHVFLVNASLGLYPQVLEDRETAKQQLGRNRWVAIYSGMRTLAGDVRQLRLDIEQGGQRRTAKTPSLFVGNNQLQLDRIGVSEAAALDTGRLAAIVVRPTSFWALLGLALRGALGTFGDADNIDSFAFRKLTVSPRGTRRVKVALDGEILWLQTPLVFEVPEPLSLMMPRPEDRAEVE